MPGLAGLDELAAAAAADLAGGHQWLELAAAGDVPCPLRPHLRADRERGELPASATLGDVLEAEAELVRRQRGRIVVPSPGELRGLPAQGWGVGGVQPGTQPEQALLSKEARRDRRR